MKKKGFLALLLGLLLLLPSGAVYAEAVPTAAAGVTDYYIEELAMTISLPSGWQVITRETPKDDPMFGENGLDHWDTMKRYKRDHIYLSAKCEAPKLELNLMMIKDIRLFDYNLYDNAMLEENVANTVTETSDTQKNRNITYQSGFLYLDHPQAKFVVYDGERADISASLRQYGTVINGQAISVILGSYEDKLSPELAATLQTIVNSITFDEIIEPPSGAVKRAKEWRPAPPSETTAADANQGGTKDAAAVDVAPGTTDSAAPTDGQGVAPAEDTAAAEEESSFPWGWIIPMICIAAIGSCVVFYFQTKKRK